WTADGVTACLPHWTADPIAVSLPGWTADPVTADCPSETIAVIDAAGHTGVASTVLVGPAADAVAAGKAHYRRAAAKSVRALARVPARKITSARASLTDHPEVRAATDAAGPAVLLVSLGVDA